MVSILDAAGEEVVRYTLDYAAARVLEQAAMLYYHTLNPNNPMNNQINGMSRRKWGIYRLTAINMLKYSDNALTNEMLCLLEDAMGG